MATKYEEKSYEWKKELNEWAKELDGLAEESNKLAQGFEDKKKAYFEARKEEAIKIIESLQKNHSVKIYDKQGEVIKKDQINSEWIALEINSKLIYLQSFDVDPNSKNNHLLMDRIGICDKKTKKMEITNIELPFDPMESLASFIEPLSEKKQVDKDFWTKKREYEIERHEQRNLLIDMLSAVEGVQVVTKKQYGKGVKGYTGNNNMSRPFDLTNWKWLDIIVGNPILKKETAFMLSLQPFYLDTNKQVKINMDEIGIYKYDDEDYKKYKEAIQNPGKFLITKNVVNEMNLTNIKLPIAKTKVKALLQFIIEKMEN